MELFRSWFFVGCLAICLADATLEFWEFNNGSHHPVLRQPQPRSRLVSDQFPGSISPIPKIIWWGFSEMSRQVELVVEAKCGHPCSPPQLHRQPRRTPYVRLDPLQDSQTLYWWQYHPLGRLHLGSYGSVALLGYTRFAALNGSTCCLNQVHAEQTGGLTWCLHVLSAPRVRRLL